MLTKIKYFIILKTLHLINQLTSSEKKFFIAKPTKHSFKLFSILNQLSKYCLFNALYNKVAGIIKVFFSSNSSNLSYNSNSTSSQVSTSTLTLAFALANILKIFVSVVFKNLYSFDKNFKIS